MLRIWNDQGPLKRYVTCSGLDPITIVKLCIIFYQGCTKVVKQDSQIFCSKGSIVQMQSQQKTAFKPKTIQILRLFLIRIRSAKNELDLTESL